MPTGEAEERAQGRQEAAPAAVIAFLLFVLLAGVSRAQEWELVGLPWWIWLLVGAPALVLAIDLSLAYRGRGLVPSRYAALLLLGLLVLGNLAALALLVAGLIKANSSDLSGGELLLTGFALWAADVIFFGLAFWELEVGAVARRRTPARTKCHFRFPQDEASNSTWSPQVWDYIYVALTNGIAFSPTDTMPLSPRAKVLMTLEAMSAMVTMVLVIARGVNLLG